jgi:hypothetical protein
MERLKGGTLLAFDVRAAEMAAIASEKDFEEWLLAALAAERAAITARSNQIGRWRPRNSKQRVLVFKKGSL